MCFFPPAIPHLPFRSHLAPLRNGHNRDHVVQPSQAHLTSNTFINLYSPSPSRSYAQAQRSKMNMPSTTSPTSWTASSPADEDPWVSAPVSRTNSVHLRRRNKTRTNSEDMATSYVHPLSGIAGSSTAAAAAGAADASRPTLRRLTTEIERQVAETSRSGSERGASLDMLRMTADPESEGVEVLVHQIDANDSLAGISLQYGIDLATLRKVNKLWASDTIHSRKSLYVPLEACRWNKATESFTRGPDANQITLTAKSARKQGKQADRSFSNLHLLDVGRTPLTRSTSGSVYGGSEWGEEGVAARSFMPDTNTAYEPLVDPPPPRFPSRPPTPSEADSATSQNADTHSVESQRQNNPSIRILNIIKLPNSQLQFFPKSQAQDDTSKLDRRPSLPSTLPPSGKIRNNLHSLPPQLKAGKTSLTASQTSTVVRLRPPTSQSTPSSRRTSSSADLTATLASRLSSLFTVPPPPVTGHSREATDSGYGSPRQSRRPSATIAQSVKPEALELHPRRSSELPRGHGNGLRTIQANGRNPIIDKDV